MKPAVPRIIDSRRVRPAGSGTTQSPGTRTTSAKPPSWLSPRPMPFTTTESPGRKRASSDDSTIPAASMPALSGKRFRIFPRPVIARASL